MTKKLLSVLWTSAILLGSVAAPALATNTAWPWWFQTQQSTILWVAWGNVWNQWNTWFITFVQNAVNWVLMFLWLITIIILIWGGFQMITAAWDDGKYKKWFTIVKQAVIWLILIWASALIVNLIFNFMGSTAWTDASWVQ